jgi:uncharacterized membrane protein required for colicin V production
LKLSNKLWWSRYLLAIIIAFISALLCFMGFAGEATPTLAFLVAVAAYALSYVFAKYVFRINVEKLDKPRDLALQGVFAYFISWFAFWVFFYTMILWASGFI